MNKKFRISDLFTELELARSARIKEHKDMVRIIVEPALDRINIVTEQENDADYLGYALLYANGVS